MNKFEKTYTPVRKMTPHENYRKNIGEFNKKVTKKAEHIDSKDSHSSELKEGVEIMKYTFGLLCLLLLLMVFYLFFNNLS
ncbi:unnamed protein product [Blepharisma stoltei]|uniref:Riboflavin synthase subunit beta n=1 Tax=Blepharisma stoltei TaxID=1481888 RepID=A0AAU9JUF6_9CILI|nr:unnamed protein product [Blepharisma stoltei]